MNLFFEINRVRIWEILQGNMIGVLDQSVRGVQYSYISTEIKENRSEGSIPRGDSGES